jgi:hypothetical protein
MIRRDDTIEGVRHYRLLGDNLTDVQNWLELTPRKWSCSYSTTTMGHSWDLGVGYRGALELARIGWSEGAKDLSDRLDAHMPPHDHEVSWRYDVAGELPDIGRFLAGDPAHMRRHGHPKGHRPIIGIAVNSALRSNAKAHQIANYGAALVAVIDRIENAGRRVELTVHNVTAHGKTRVSMGWVVKKADDPFDLAAVAFSLAHPASVRRIVFAMMEHSTLPSNPGYGRIIQVTEDDLVDPLPNTFLINGVGHSPLACDTLTGAIARVTQQVNEAAGEELVTME